MRNFIAFIQRFRILLFFAFLQGIALYFYFSYVAFPRTQFLTTASSINGSILSVRNGVTKHFSLEENNQALQAENIKLRESLPLSFIKMENGWVKINDTIHHKQFEYIPAVIINATFHKRNNYFTLNIGTDQGIERGMGVFSDKGIVGKIHNSSVHFSVVKSVLTSDINTTLLIQGANESGILKWDGRNPKYGVIDGVSNDAEIKLNAKVVTRGSAGIFPAGLPVGTIKSFDVVEGQPLWNIKIKYSEDYRTLQNVYVIKNRLQEEQLNLESQIPSNNE